MSIPKKIKKDIKLTPEKILLERREQLLDFIQRDGTYLPKGVEHADLDRGVLDFVKTELETSTEGKKIPTVDIIITTQNWSQFTETWNFQDLDKNISPPFIATVRVPEVKYGTNPSLQYTIPNRKQFYYAKVPTWDGQRKGMDIYKIPQPIPVDITYNIKIFCNRMRELNDFNKKVLQKFSSRQSYTFIKGHYIPIIWENVSDESELTIEKRKYYIQNYQFTLLGFIMDENEFEVVPAISRTMTLLETNTSSLRRKVNKQPPNPNKFDLDISFSQSITELSENFKYTANIIVQSLINIDTYSVYINDNYIGDNISLIPVNTNDEVRIEIVKNDSLLSSTIKSSVELL
jgi:hypothetical protein